ncbi:MAG TPA: hypothetical protein VIN03_21265 [Roseateles sp.]
MKKSSTDPEPRQAESACADSTAAAEKAATGESSTADFSRERVNIRLGALGPRLRAVATLERTSVSALMRRATVLMLRDKLEPGDRGGEPHPSTSSDLARVNLSLPKADADALAARARAADMSRSEFVWSLIKGNTPPPIPADFASGVRALYLSTDGLALLSTDLSAFLRLLDKASQSASELQPYRESLRALHKDVRGHLKRASVLLAALEPYRRPRP